MISLKKDFEIGSLRWIGKHLHGLTPKKLPIAGASIADIISATGYSALKVRGERLKDVFILTNGLCYYIYVSPNYKRYRKLAKRRFVSIPKGVHVDHTLAKNLARRHGYNYVLLALVSGRVNMSHGSFEKNFENASLIPRVCFADIRIMDKILSRKLYSRRRKGEILAYSPVISEQSGLTLKQLGMWHSSFGLDKPIPSNFIEV